MPDFRKVKAVRDFGRDGNQIPKDQEWTVTKDERDLLVSQGLVEDVTKEGEVVKPNEGPKDSENLVKVRALKDFKEGAVQRRVGEEWETAKDQRDALTMRGEVEDVSSAQASEETTSSRRKRAE